MVRKQDPEAYRRWAASNPDKVAAKRKRRYARSALLMSALVKEDIHRLFDIGCVLVPGWPDYLVSPVGEVYSTLRGRLRQLKPGVKPGGYEFVGVGTQNNRRYLMVHRVVAMAFIPNPDDLPAVNHRDGNKRNNRVENLEWCTHIENSAHALRTGLYRTGTEHHNAKLTDDQVRDIRESTDPYKVIGRRHGVCSQTVCNIKKGIRYRDVA